MKIEEKSANDTITINFIVHRAIVYSNIIHCAGKTPDEIFNEKLLIIKKISDEKGVYLEFAGKQKEIIKEWAKIDKQFKDLYKKLYPVGGWRNGGRPKGSKTDKTNMLKVRITPEEEKFLLEKLEEYRQNKKQESIISYHNGHAYRVALSDFPEPGIEKTKEFLNNYQKKNKK